MVKYSVQVFCPECGGQHDTGIKLSLEDGPAVEQSMGEFYESKELPSDIASLRNNTFSCPRTRKTFVPIHRPRTVKRPRRRELAEI
jgi:hypothetical protein